MSALGVVTTSLTIWLFFTLRDRPAFVVMGTGSMAIALVFAAWLLPAFGPLNALRLASGSMRAAGFEANDSVALVGYAEPSITFYLNGQGRELGPEFLSQYPAGQWPKWWVISSANWNKLPADERAQLIEVGEFQIISAGSKRGNQSIIVAQSRGAAMVTMARTPLGHS
jgi:hypothetical protein